MLTPLSLPELEACLHRIYPPTAGRFSIIALGDTELEMVLHVNQGDWRPGGTVSGPSMFALVDCAFYALVLSRIGDQALAVTTNVSINFMRKPPLQDLLCRTRLLKHGRQLCVGDALVYADQQVVAQASLTYSIPPPTKD